MIVNEIAMWIGYLTIVLMTVVTLLLIYSRINDSLVFVRKNGGSAVKAFFGAYGSIDPD